MEGETENPVVEHGVQVPIEQEARVHIEHRVQVPIEHRVQVPDPFPEQEGYSSVDAILQCLPDGWKVGIYMAFLSEIAFGIMLTLLTVLGNEYPDGLGEYGGYMHNFDVHILQPSCHSEIITYIAVIVFLIWLGPVFMWMNNYSKEQGGLSAIIMIFVYWCIFTSILISPPFTDNLSGYQKYYNSQFSCATFIHAHMNHSSLFFTSYFVTVIGAVYGVCVIVYKIMMFVC